MSEVKLLQNGNTPLHHASWYSHVAAIEVLLRNGAAINQTSNILRISLLHRVHIQATHTKYLDTHAQLRSTII